MQNNDVGESKKVALRKSTPFDEYQRSLNGLSPTAIQERFEGSQIQEVREQCIHNMTCGTPSGYDPEWVEQVIVQLGMVYEPVFQARMLEWYLKGCVRSPHPRSVRAFRFVCELCNTIPN